MNVFEIIGESKPNKVRLISRFDKSNLELPKSVVRRKLECGIMKITNPESLYVRL